MASFAASMNSGRTALLQRGANQLRGGLTPLPRAHRMAVLPVRALFSSAKTTAKQTSKQAARKPVKAAPKQKKVAATSFKTTIGKDTKATITLGFTKSNELFVGRLAMLGIATAIIGEIITGKGALGQLGLETHLSVTDLGGFVIAGIIFNLLAAFAPASGKFVPEEESDFSDRTPGALQDANVTLLDPKRFFGVKGFGFTKENELFVGRMAQLGFAASLIGEWYTGKGPLAQFDFETGIPLTETEPLLLFFILFTLFAAVNEGSGKFVDE